MCNIGSKPHPYPLFHPSTMQVPVIILSTHKNSFRSHISQVHTFKYVMSSAWNTMPHHSTSYLDNFYLHFSLNLDATSSKHISWPQIWTRCPSYRSSSTIYPPIRALFSTAYLLVYSPPSNYKLYGGKFHIFLLSQSSPQCLSHACFIKYLLNSHLISQIELHKIYEYFSNNIKCKVILTKVSQVNKM